MDRWQQQFKKEKNLEWTPLSLCVIVAVDSLRGKRARLVQTYISVNTETNCYVTYELK
jgi:hypothetical protein